jgi:hypothetical protein
VIFQKVQKGLQVVDILTTPMIYLEAAPGFEPGNNGFADRCLSHLAMPPWVFPFMERETGLEPATITLAT